jgi:predicted lipoprotein
MQLGPAGSVAKRVMGAQDLRDRIYAWPTFSACRVDQELVAGGFTGAGFVDRALVNVTGLAAIEYLLFVDGAANACPPQVAINADGAWAALEAAERDRRRAAFARVLAAGVVVQARRLRDAWEPGGGDFLGQVLRAGEEGSSFRAPQEVLDAAFAAMFYADQEVKDMKLARPAGLAPECAAEVCPEAVESPYADHGAVNVARNMAGLRRLLLGGAPAEALARTGFDDLLRAVNAADLAAELDAAVAEAERRAAAIDGGLAASIRRDPADAQALHAAVKGVTDLLKSRFVTVLALRVPDEGAADND